MKILVVDADRLWVDCCIGTLREIGLDAKGIMPTRYGIEMFNCKNLFKKIPSRKDLLEDKDVISLVRDADVIFLSVDMPNMKGKQLLDYWKSNAVDFSKKRVIGLSPRAVPYLNEHFFDMDEPHSLKKFLGF